MPPAAMLSVEEALRVAVGEAQVGGGERNGVQAAQDLIGQDRVEAAHGPADGHGLESRREVSVHEPPGMLEKVRIRARSAEKKEETENISSDNSGEAFARAFVCGFVCA